MYVSEENKLKRYQTDSNIERNVWVIAFKEHFRIFISKIN